MLFLAVAIALLQQHPPTDRAAAIGEAARAAMIIDQAAAADTASEADDPADAAFDYMMGRTADGTFSACIPAQNAEAQLGRVHEQMQTALRLLRLEQRDQPSSRRLQVIGDLLADDGEMTLARYAVQEIAGASCQD